MTVNDSAQASDGFGVVSTPVPTAIEPAPINPAEPTRRRASGRVDFPGGVTVAPLGGQTLSSDHVIYLDGLGWMTIGMAKSYAASLAGAVIEAEWQAAENSKREAEAEAVTRISYGCTVLAALFVVVALVTKTQWMAWAGMGLALLGTIVFATDYWQLHRKPRHRLRDE